MDSLNTPLFVYGTLVKGGKLHSNLADSIYLGDYLVDDYAMFKVTDWYPGIYPVKGETVLGEVYNLKGITYQEIDEIEGDSYERVKVKVNDSVTDAILECYTYQLKENIYQKLNEDNIWWDKKVKVFGYGSLMLSSELKRTLKRYYDIIRKLPYGRLDGYRLIYDYYAETRRGGALDVIESSGDHVLGTVIEMTYSAMIRIDNREGHPNTYKRTRVTVDCADKEISVYCYIVNNYKRENCHVAPTDVYHTIVLEGMEENGFPQEYVDSYKKVTDRIL